MKKYLYILCEGENDEMFYERLAERVTGLSFETPTDFRLRRGSNFKTAIANARLLLDRVRHWTGKQEVSVILAVDNDRASGHPGSEPPPQNLPKFDRKKEARYPALQKMLEEKLGPDRTQWPVEAALAMPVEMIESWLLVLLNSDRDELPLFSKAQDKITREFYGKSPPPPQLKDLRDEEARTRGIRVDELFLKAADVGDLARLAELSPSFALFERELRAWDGVSGE